MSSRRLAQRSLHLLDAAGRAAESSSESQRRHAGGKKSKAKGAVSGTQQAREKLRKKRGKRSRAERVDLETKTAAQVEQELKAKMGEWCGVKRRRNCEKGEEMEEAQRAGGMGETGRARQAGVRGQTDDRAARVPNVLQRKRG